jgi:enoyl-CoA hydratase
MSISTGGGAITANGLRIDVVDRVALVVLDRPERLNALSAGLQADIISAFDRFEEDDDVWAVLLTGAGDRAFSAGVDLKEINAGDGESRPPTLPMRGTGRNVFETVLECGKPVVAALNGVAVGGGCELALACDVRFAAEGVRLGLPEAKRGMGANFGCQVLPRLVPRGIAYEMLYGGEFLTAEEAQRWGLVNRVVPRGRLLDESMAFCRQIVANAPLTVRRYKAMIGKGADLPLAAALRLNVGPNPYRSEDRAEGVAAFLEKRPPVWRAR